MLIDEIVKMMAKKRIKQKDMAQRIGVTEVTMHRWISGKRYPSINYVEKMAKELDCDITVKERK